MIPAGVGTLFTLFIAALAHADGLAAGIANSSGLHMHRRLCNKPRPPNYRARGPLGERACPGTRSSCNYRPRCLLRLSPGDIFLSTPGCHPCFNPVSVTTLPQTVCMYLCRPESPRPPTDPRWMLKRDVVPGCMRNEVASSPAGPALGKGRRPVKLVRRWEPVLASRPSGTGIDATFGNEAPTHRDGEP